MLTTFNPGLRRSNVVLDSFHSCIPNAPKEFSRTPEMSFWEISPQPRMFMQKFKGTVSFKQLESSANTHSWRNLDEQMDMVNSDVEFINFTPIPSSSCIEKSLTIHFKPIKLERIHSVFNFPDKMESILSESMAKTFQIHFFAPKTLARNKVHTKFVNLFHEGKINPLDIQELNINKEDGNSSLGSRAEVSLP